MSMHFTAIATLALTKHWPAEVCVQLADLFKKEDEFRCDAPAFRYNHFLLECGLVKEGDQWIRI